MTRSRALSLTLALALAPLYRLRRSPRAWLPIVAWIAFAIVGALFAHRGGAVHGADRALLGAYGVVALPLLVYGVVAAALGGDSLSRSGLGLVLFGAPPFRVARDTVLVAMGASAGLGAALAMVVCAVGHGSADPPLARDLAVCAEIGALGGAAYAAFFAFGASFGARGLGRSLFLVADWLLGSGHGVGAVLMPRAHVHSLLGGPGPAGMGPHGSTTALVLLALTYAALAVGRAGRAQWALPRQG